MYTHFFQVPESYINKVEVVQDYTTKRKQVITTAGLDLQITDNTFQVSKKTKNKGLYNISELRDLQVTKSKNKQN